MNTKYLVVRHGEFVLKGKNRSLFLDKFVYNITSKLSSAGSFQVRRLQGRILIEFKEPVSWRELKDKVRKVFGFSTASPVYRTDVSMEELETALVSHAKELDFSSFAVRTKRANKTFPKPSPEISRDLGSAIYTALDGKAKVDLTNPEVTFYVEILDRDIFFSSEKFKGAGGLPVGISGHVLSLLSGGIDSPVSSWMMMSRGLKNSFVHFHSKPFTNDASIEKVEDMATKLGEWQGKTRLALVPFGNLQKKIVTGVPSKYRVLMYRRFMVRIANIVAKMIKAKALVSGESLGQVASQTLSNLGSVEAISELPILRPLIGMDKQEIVDMAKKIDTFELSIQPHQDCCSFLQPPNPATRTTPEELDRVESELDVEGMVQEALSGIDWIEL